MKQVIVTKGKQSKQLEDGHMYFTPTSLILFLAGIAWMLFEIGWHQDTDPVFASQNAAFFWMAMPGIGLFVIFLAIKRGYLVSEEAFGGWGRVMIMVAACTAANIVINAICGVLMEERATWSIESIEIYLFYAVSAPVAEESLYRVFICNVVIIAIMAAFKLAGKSKKNDPLRITIANITAIAVSGVSFSLAHLGVYGDEPLMLLSNLLGGTVMAGFYVYTKNPFVPLFAHLVNNAIAAGVIITNAVMVIA